MSQQEYNGAIEKIESAKKLCLSLSDKKSEHYLEILLQCGKSYQYSGKGKKAEDHYNEILTILGHSYNEKHEKYAKTLDNLGMLKAGQGKYEAAETYYLKAISIKEKTLGINHSDYAYTLNNLATAYRRMGNYEKSMQLYLEAKNTWKETLGENHYYYTYVLNNLGNLYSSTGHLENAEFYYTEAKKIKDRNDETLNSFYAVLLNNLALLKKDLGFYEQSESLYLKAKDIWGELFGKKHTSYAHSLNNLSDLYKEIENYDKAEPLILEAKNIWEESNGKEHPNYARAVNNLALIYEKTGKKEEAEQLLLEAKNIWEKSFGKEHHNYAEATSNLALFYHSVDNFAKAEQYNIEALEIRKKTLGEHHPSYAESLIRLGTLYMDINKLDDVEPLLVKAKSIRENSLHKKHPDYAASLNQLAKFYTLNEHHKKAEPYYNEANDIEKSMLINGSMYLSEKELSKYINKYIETQALHFSFAQVWPDHARNCYDNTLFYKGFLLNTSNKINELALTDSISTNIYFNLKSLHRRLASEYTKPLSEQNDISELEEKANTLEKELAQKVAKLSTVSRQVTWKNVQENLMPEEAAIEFISFPSKNDQGETYTLYGAMVLRQEQSSPTFITLAEEEEIITYLADQDESSADHINSTYSSVADNSIYNLIWRPLKKELSEINTIYFSPTGLLHRLNIGAILANDSSIISDSYQLVQLNSTRQIALGKKRNSTSPDTTESISKKQAVLFGGIDFESNNQPTRGASPRGTEWHSLPWTEVEVSGLQIVLEDAGLSAIVHSGNNASEEKFKELGSIQSSPHILHLATHGFFFPPPTLNKKSTTSPIFEISDKPMIRSGLVLAGGNFTWRNGKPTNSEKEDGILTAYEISQMDLSNTELVVLSACETGLGDIDNNEGVFGLQRAFKIAGAKYLIMSLWQVPDFQTQELMTAFYSNWIEENKSVPEAFRLAQNEMRKKYKEPNLWAGFILVE